MIAFLTNHLWQSTLFVVAAWLVANAIRRNGAHVRHRIWLVASLKCLAFIPVDMRQTSHVRCDTCRTSIVSVAPW